ncbi:MAG: 8-amino-7-oxononanoate synthase [Legionellaceae bacterium]|nr:8-amino-7-oxononanoate synthase [Legionellaceae bacterium]HCA89225.1 8-amino-7-oxononanoate synthase [Legionellales bacterium]|tara:strand:+ start:219 stop:1364 length:1146 start_codon:yes stop_codon:yes gene_type:complete
MTTFNTILTSKLKALDKQHLKRSRMPLKLSAEQLNFTSNDYLSLSANKALRQHYIDGFTNYPIGSGASMTVSGYHPLHQTLEQNFASYTQCDSALLFNSGFSANLSIMNLMAYLQSQALVDKSCHASIYDGLKASNIKYQRFAHNSIQHLLSKIDHNQTFKIILTEGVFSLSGQISKLNFFRSVCQKNTYIKCFVDEAHAFGVLGPHGLGATAYFNLKQDTVPLRMIAFGKALNCQGAVVVGEKLWIEALYQCARSNIYTTAISPALTWGLIHALEFVMAADDKRCQLNNIIRYFHENVICSPLSWSASQTAIQQLKLGCPVKALRYAEELNKVGILCYPMRYPTLSKPDTGLRIVLNADHKPKDIELLFHHLHRLHDSIH